MNNYIFSVIAGACVMELVTEFMPFSDASALKKYVKYVFSLVLVICIVSPFVGQAAKRITDGVIPDEKYEFPSISVTGCVYYEDNTAYKCTEGGLPDYTQKILLDNYIKHCFAGIVDNAKSAICEKFGIEKEKITLGIAFNATDTQSIRIIRAYVGIKDGNGYLQSDVKQYLESLLETKVGGLR